MAITFMQTGLIQKVNPAQSSELLSFDVNFLYPEVLGENSYFIKYNFWDASLPDAPIDDDDAVSRLFVGDLPYGVVSHLDRNQYGNLSLCFQTQTVGCP